MLNTNALSLSGTKWWKSPSVIAILLCISVIAVYNYLYFSTRLIAWDVFGHYFYLHLVFIKGDITFKNAHFVESIVKEYNISSSLYQLHKSETGYWVIRYPAGASVLQLPFFLIGHLAAKIFHYKADGFSLPYNYAMMACSWFYAIAGMVYLRKLLKRFFSEPVVAITLLLIVVSSNTYAYFVQNVSVHNLLFFLTAFILHTTFQWTEKPGIKRSLLLGFAIGISFISRHTELIVCVFPALLNVYNKESAVQKWQFLLRHKRYIFMAGGAFLIAISPQIIYWKIVTSHFLYNGYCDNPGEGLDLLYPHLSDYLFSFRKGWLVYSPIMIFSLVGLFFMYKRNKTIYLSFTVFCGITIYVLSSWTIWWYAESFGQRSIVQAYPVFAIPLGFFIQHLLTRHAFQKIAFTITALAFTLLSHFQYWQIQQGILHPSLVTPAYYFKTFLKTRLQGNEAKLLLIDHHNPNLTFSAVKHDYHYVNTYSVNPQNEPQRETENGITYHVYTMQKTDTFNTHLLKVPFHQLVHKDHAWFRCSVKIKRDSSTQHGAIILSLVNHHSWKTYSHRSVEKPIDSIPPGIWQEITMETLSAVPRHPGKDMVKLQLWNRDGLTFAIKDLKIEVFEKND